MGDKKSEQICIRIEPEVYKKLKEYADLEERSVGYLMRKMVDSFLKRKDLEEEKKSPVKKGA